MNEIKTLIYQRAVISDDAVGTNVKTLDFGDAGKDIAYIAIYARFKDQNSSYSCQLAFSRSYLIPDNMTTKTGIICSTNQHTQRRSS